jgi:hypothetical protein
MAMCLMANQHRTATAQLSTLTYQSSDLAGRKCTALLEINGPNKSLRAAPNQFTVVQFAPKVNGGTTMVDLENEHTGCTEPPSQHLTQASIDDIHFNRYQLACRQLGQCDVVNWGVDEKGDPYVIPNEPGGNLMPSPPKFNPTPVLKP